MNIKTCRHCDIGFYRNDASPIPHDRCLRCHEEIEAMGGKVEGNKNWQWRSAGSVECACGDKYHGNSYGAGFMAANNGVCENCDVADGHPLDRLAQAALTRVAAKCERGDMETRSNEHDPVTRPAHYQSDEGIECIDAVRAALGLEGFVAHCRGTAIKYAWRAGSKGDAAECLRKGAWYLERAAKELEK